MSIGQYVFVPKSEEALAKQLDLQTITSGYRTGFINAMMPFEQTPTNLIAARRENLLVNAEDLYHYTSLSGFQGIIDSGGFWASDNRFMNDAEEIHHGINIAINILNHRIKRASQDFAVVLTDVRSRLLEPIKNGNLITCFSTARDSLEQWRGYGVNGAVSIRLGQAYDGERNVFFAPHQIAFGVKYNARAKSVSLLSVLRRFASEYALDRQAMPAGQWPARHDDHYAEHLLDVLSMQVKAFKDPAFAQEREVRIVLSFKEVDNFRRGLQFRVSPFGLVPFVNTGDRIGMTGKLPIREVIIGPAARQNLIAESIMTFLEAKEYINVKITLSSVPFRSAS